MPRARNVYFGPRSILKAVKDVGKPGVHSAREVKALAVAQLLDWLDGKTVSKRTGKVVRFTNRLWAGRLHVLYILASKYGGKRAVREIEKIKKMVEEREITKSEARRLALQLAKKWHVRELIRIRRLV